MRPARELTRRLSIADGAIVAAVSVGFAIYAVVSAQQSHSLGPLEANGRVTYFIADGMAGSEFRPSDRDLATWALKDWERSTNGRIHFEPAAERDALVRVYWVPASAGLYGEMRPVTVNGRRGAEVFIRPDTSGLGDEIARMARTDALMRETIVYLTCVHELGHALGLDHTSDFRDIMYFFGFGGDIPGFFNRYRTQLKRREDIVRVSGLSDGDMQKVGRLYEASTK